MDSFFQAILSTLRAKFTPIWTKFKMWTNASFIKTKAATSIRTFFTKVFDVRPRHKKDYYTVFGWMISRRLAFAAVLLAGVLSVYYFVFINPPSVFQHTGIKTYYYDSVPLRFTKGSVMIKARSGYVAYRGDVAGGQAVGQGILYSPEGKTIYMGGFDNNEYNGQGKLYYKNEIMQYEGAFKDNLFEGQGTLYRSTGSKEYKGAFAMGKKDGEGTLFDTANNPVYTGSFAHDDLVYSELIGKSTAQVAQYYTGSTVVYSDDAYYAVVMKDINAVYFGDNRADVLSQNVNVEGVYVLSGIFPAGDIECTTMEEVKQYFGDSQYEGNSSITMPEAVGIEYLNQSEGARLPVALLETSSLFDDALQVTGYDRDYAVYLYSFVKDGLTYTFFCNGRNTEFAMYQITT